LHTIILKQYDKKHKLTLCTIIIIYNVHIYILHPSYCKVYKIFYKLDILRQTFTNIFTKSPYHYRGRPTTGISIPTCGVLLYAIPQNLLCSIIPRLFRTYSCGIFAFCNCYHGIFTFFKQLPCQDLVPTITLSVTTGTNNILYNDTPTSSWNKACGGRGPEGKQS